MENIDLKKLHRKLLLVYLSITTLNYSKKRDKSNGFEIDGAFGYEISIYKDVKLVKKEIGHQNHLLILLTI